MNATLITGHEADVAATENAELTGEFIAIKIRVIGTGATLAPPGLKLGRQADGSIVLMAETFRRWSQSKQSVTASVLLTTFVPRAPNWVEEGFDPSWRVDWDNCRHPLIGFGAGQICDYWDGRRG